MRFFPNPSCLRMRTFIYHFKAFYFHFRVPLELLLLLFYTFLCSGASIFNIVIFSTFQLNATTEIVEIFCSCVSVWSVSYGVDFRSVKQ